MKKSEPACSHSDFPLFWQPEHLLETRLTVGRCVCDRRCCSTRLLTFPSPRAPSPPPSITRPSFHPSVHNLLLPCRVSSYIQRGEREKKKHSSLGTSAPQTPSSICIYSLNLKFASFYSYLPLDTPPPLHPCVSLMLLLSNMIPVTDYDVFAH